MSKSFVDKIRIFVKGGNGGRGACSFERAKYVPLGGPDGGDGGRGGHVILRANENLTTLLDFTHKAHFRAESGTNGGKSNKAGANGKDMILQVPVGTLVFDNEDGRCLADLAYDGAEFMAAQGGRGGRGNARFITQTNHGPRDHELGEPGDERWLRLDLRVVAQVGIIGFPNVGKSTLLATITNAEPAVADYPFTTLNPVLGVLERNYSRLVFADIPGLIEGAAEGAGLGHDFLRHIERTRVLLHLLDASGVDPENPLAKYNAIRHEIESYSEDLAFRPEVIAVNKLDVEGGHEKAEALRRALEAQGKKLFAISCLSGEGLEELIAEMFVAVDRAPQLAPRLIEPDLPDDPEDYSVTNEDGVWVVRGRRLDKAVAMTDLDEEESVNRLQRRFDAWGVEDRLAEAGAVDGDPVFIAGFEFSYKPAPKWLSSIEDKPTADMRPSQVAKLAERKELADQRAQKRQSLAGLAGLRGRGRRKR